MRKPTTRRLAAVLALGALTASLAACGSGDGGGGDAGDAGGDEGSSTLNVLAAASLTETFTSLAEDFEADHDGVKVTLVFDSSATLAQQAVDGAPGDLLATADQTTMDAAVDGGAVPGDSEAFASNVLVIATPADNPKQIEAIDDLQADDVTYVACVETAPCGKVAEAVLGDNDITHEPASLEVDVKAVLAKVTEDEADAGLVYATDATAAGDAVQRVDIAGAESERTTYPIAVLEQSEDSALAQEFMDLVLSEAGQQTLGDAGFGAP